MLGRSIEVVFCDFLATSGRVFVFERREIGLNMRVSSGSVV